MVWRTVAICDEHFAEEHPGRIPYRVVAEWETSVTEACYRDGCDEVSNIYVRRDVR